MFSVSLFLYNLSDITEETEDKKLISKYRQCFRKLDNTQLGIIFEALSKLSKEQLTSLKLKYEPRSERYFATLFILLENQSYRSSILFKDDSDINRPSYIFNG